jgi:hypothetical protein
MTQSALPGPAPGTGYPVVFFGIGARDAARTLRQVSSTEDPMFYAWKNGSRWHAYVNHKQSGFVHGRQRIIGLAIEFAKDFNVSDVVQRWLENGPRAQLAIVVWDQKPEGGTQ